MTETDVPKVCVRMLVYNHARWVAQAIEGVLMQETDFRVKLLIGEDCSTDNSREIVKAYKARYPDRIELVLSDHNLGMTGNALQLNPYTKGEYVAVCEGDDFWTDSHKLQIQVDFLDANPDYVACFHAVRIVDENGDDRDLQIEAYTSTEEFDYPLEWAGSMRLPGQSCSVVRRNYTDNLSDEIKRARQACRTNGDQKSIILDLMQGKIKRMGRCMACYRRTYTGDSWNARISSKEMAAFSYIGFLEVEKFANFCLPIRVNRHPEARTILQNFLEGFKGNIHKDKYKALWQMFAYSPSMFVKFAVVDRLAKSMRPLVRSLLIRWEREQLYRWACPHYIVFGTGDIGGQCLALLSLAGLSERIVCLWDNDRRKIGMIISGHEIRIPNWGQAVAETMVIIATNRYTQEMRSQLEDMGLVYGQDMLSYDGFCRQLEKVIQLDHPYIYDAFWHK